MTEQIKNLLEFFGLSEAPETLSEFIPYFMGGMLSIGILLFILQMLRFWGNGGGLK